MGGVSRIQGFCRQEAEQAQILGLGCVTLSDRDQATHERLAVSGLQAELRGHRAEPRIQYGQGAVASFLHTHLVGVRLPENPGPDEAGYRLVRIAPVVGGGLTEASSTLATPLGELRVGWRIQDGQFALDAQLPSETTAEIELPDGSRHRATGGSVQLVCAAPTTASEAKRGA